MADDEKDKNGAAKASDEAEPGAETPAEITTQRAARKESPEDRAAAMAAENASTVPGISDKDRKEREERAASMAAENAEAASGPDDAERKDREKRAAAMAAENAATNDPASR